MADSAPPVSPLLQAVLLKMERLSLQREQILRQLSEVDAQIQVVANALGLNEDDLAAPVGERPMPRSRSDRRRAGSMVEFVVNTIADHHDGITRGELKDAITGHAEFGPKFKSNPNHFYNLVKRSIDRSEIDEKWGRLWLAGRAPESAPTPFGDRTLFNSEGGGNA